MGSPAWGLSLFACRRARWRFLSPSRLSMITHVVSGDGGIGFDLGRPWAVMAATSVSALATPFPTCHPPSYVVEFRGPKRQPLVSPKPGIPTWDGAQHESS